MTEKTARQIENLKNQTFGVEIEMNHITRRKAAETAAAYFGTGRAGNTASRNGYMCWSAWDVQGREWKFQRDVSIAGPDDEKCEMVTPVLSYGDMETLQELVRRLRKAGARSDYTQMCGVHVHVGSEGHTPQSIRALVNMMHSHEAQLIDAVRIDRTRMARYCRTVDPDFLERLNRQKPKTMDALARCWYNGPADHSHYSSTRYRMCNLHSLFNRYHTIEFRLWQFDAPADGKQNGLHAGQIKSMIQLCMAMSALAKEIKYASPKPQQNENTRYALRCFLLRLGFIGDEFKTARDYFLRNAEGNAAWRHGIPA